jgi:hypothetical protein
LFPDKSICHGYAILRRILKTCMAMSNLIGNRNLPNPHQRSLKAYSNTFFYLRSLFLTDVRNQAVTRIATDV